MKKEITPNYHAWFETQLRYGLDAGGTNQILYRVGVLNQIIKNHEVGLLYAYVQGGVIKEHRFALQHVRKYGIALGLKWSHRVRFEGRFPEDSDDDAGRFRYLLRAESETNDFPALVFWDEIFLNTTRDSWTGNRLDERNRLFIGTKVNFANLRGEFGYLNQFVSRRQTNMSEHIATVYFFF